MVEKRFEKLGMPDIERFENYLPTAFNSELTLLQKVNKIIFDLIETNKLTNEMVEYLNWFIETFDEKLYKTIEDVLSVWLEDGRLADVVRAAINEEVVEARNDYSTLKERLDSEKADVDTQLTHMVTIDFVKDCGGIGDGITNNYMAFIKLSKKVNSLKENVKVLFPPGRYKYKPLLPLQDSWRNLIEIVDCNNIYYTGKGAVIIQEKDSAWTSGYTPSGMREQESPIQFRGTLENSSENIIVESLKILGDRVPFSASQGGDGNCIGLYFRGVEGIVVRDVVSNGWGTDGITLGRNYGNTHKSKKALLYNVLCDNNTRQGLSITGADNVIIDSSTFKNTNGGSFGHGIDLETNEGLQRNIKIINSDFFNNERGALNVIGTEDVIMKNCFIEELNCDGAIYADATVRRARNVRISDTTIKTNKAVFYCQGTDVKDFIFTNCVLETTSKPSNNATIRINFGNKSVDLHNIGFKNCEFKGTGGILANMGEGTFVFEDNDMNIHTGSSIDKNVYDFNIQAKASFRRNNIRIGSDVESTSKLFSMTDGVFEDNYLESHLGSPISIRDSRSSSVLKLVIGKNKFTEHFYYKGEHAELDVKTEGTIIEQDVFGRKVHGGYRRTISGKNAEVGDIVFMPSNPTGSALISRCTISGSPGTWESLINVL